MYVDTIFWASSIAFDRLLQRSVRMLLRARFAPTVNDGVCQLTLCTWLYPHVSEKASRLWRSQQEHALLSVYPSVWRLQSGHACWMQPALCNHRRLALNFSACTVNLASFEQLINQSCDVGVVNTPSMGVALRSSNREHFFAQIFASGQSAKNFSSENFSPYGIKNSILKILYAFKLWCQTSSSPLRLGKNYQNCGHSRALL